MHLACPACMTVNRVPQQRLGDDPKCGKCRAALLDGVPVELNARNFSGFVSGSDLPVVADFWAEWCAPCKMMAPVFAQVARAMRAQVRFAKVDTEQNQGLAQRFAIRSIPTLVLFRGGAEADRVSGALDAGALQSWLLRHAG